ncbi:nuclear transport factor 2 family protein [Planotetraspora sp. A-T 1434]|uniref:nuclear transport factor 2 family protein n=1 Tax=Planotetraspora sp. A-T 1434 TaxID=2979219 RepID=UPI0021C1C0FE|nr:nuclear transport factor 2 family protein [Planotetraspora sp. A-T 1434]MCT9935291.1 nuclear transport factor 2 family protein [Planotetraspora sp. A-T 1434]
MTESTNPFDVVHAVYAALNAGDVPALFALTDPEVDIYQSEELPYGGHHHGYDGMKVFLEGVRTALDSQIEIGELYRAGDKVVQIGRTRGTARATGVSFDAAEVQVWGVRDGRIVSLTVFTDTDALGAALNTGPAS